MAGLLIPDGVWLLLLLFNAPYDAPAGTLASLAGESSPASKCARLSGGCEGQFVPLRAAGNLAVLTPAERLLVAVLAGFGLLAT